MSKLTYLDAGVLIAAARGTTPVSEAAMRILDDPTRLFASSVFVKLEVIPKPVYHRQSDEVEFYSEFFRAVSRWADDLDEVVANAIDEACISGLSAIDSLHVASAIALGADKLVTTEAPTKPMHRVKSLRVVTIHPA